MRIPLRSESRATGADVFRDPGIALQVFCNSDEARAGSRCGFVDRLQKTPSIRQLLGAAFTTATNVQCAVKTETID
ncbi:MAG: hypothetical protein ACK56I_20965, partial [bacterium]